MVVAAIEILVFLILVGLVFWVLSQIPGIPEPIRKVIYIVLVVICVIVLCVWLLNLAGSGLSLNFPRR